MARLLVCRGRVRRALATPARAAGAGRRASSDRPTPIIRQIGPVRAAPDQTPARSAPGGRRLRPGSRRPAAARQPGQRGGSPVVSSSRARIRRRPADRVPAAGGAASAPPARRFPTAAPRDRPRPGWPRPGRKWVQPSTSTSAPASRSSRTGASTAARRAGLPARRARPGRPTRGGPQQDAHLGRFTLHQGGELAAGQRAGGGEHADHAAGGQVGGGLMAGSTPITIRPVARARSAMAAAVAMLQATTMALAPRSTK